jgi:hypothetical protein
MMLKVVLQFTASQPKKENTNSAKSNVFNLGKLVYRTLLLTMQELFVTLIQQSKSMTLFDLTWNPTKLPGILNLMLEILQWLLLETILVV